MPRLKRSHTAPASSTARASSATRSCGYDTSTISACTGSAVACAVGCSSRRMILPLVVFGRSSMISTTRGYLYAAMRSRANARISSGVTVLPGLQADDGLDRLAAIRVGDADDGRLAHGRMLIEHLLDLARPDLEARRDDHVLRAVDEIEPALLVHEADVAGLQARRPSATSPSPRASANSRARSAARRSRTRRSRAAPLRGPRR